MTLAWHFVGDTLRNGDPIPPDGEWLEYHGECRMCESGLHASRRLIDALQYAPGNTICRVRVDDIAEEQDDKLVCRRRQIVWRVDGKELLREFARKQALGVAHLWDMPPVVRKYLETGDKAISDAARDAAWAAAERAAARDAAGETARDAVWAATARVAAWDAARAAVWAATARVVASTAARVAASTAARIAAWDAARAAARAAAGETARDAAGEAAWAAARAAANKQLTAMILAAHKEQGR